MSPIEEKIKHLLKSKSLDVRASKYRYMDQKVTPDVVAFIADCVLNLSSAEAENFSKNTVWHSSYFSKNVVFIYNKPDANNETMSSEYDKFCAQPLKALSYAGVLAEEKVGNENRYTVVDREILEYISLSDRNAFNFLRLYLEKVMKDSGFYGKFETYITKYKSGLFGPADFTDLKSSFESFMLGNTNINQVTEIRRIFPKILNIFAVADGTAGSRSGRVTEGRYLYSDLMYNATNFRDLGKLKNVSRQEADKVIETVESYNKYEEAKAMAAVRKRHSPNSEVRDMYANGEATQVHHIFPRSTNIELRSTLENLILLTATQHNSKAHPSNKTATVDPAYQLECLLAKSDSIKQSVMNDDGFYSKEGLVTVLNTGLSFNVNANMSFDDINQRIRRQLQSS